MAIREGTNLAHTAYNLFFRGRQRDTHIIFCHQTEGAAGRGGYIAFAQQVKGELSPSTPCTVRTCNIDQDVECSVRGVDVTTEILKQAHREITASLIGLSHFGDACLRT